MEWKNIFFVKLLMCKKLQKSEDQATAVKHIHLLHV